MPLNSLGVGFAFTATDLASGVIGRLEGNFARLEGRSQRSASIVNAGFRVMGIGAASVAAGVGLLGAAFAAADIAGQFEQGIAAVAAVASDGRDHLNELRDAALQAGVETQYGPQQAAEALQNLAQAGFDSRRSIELLNPALHLAAASLGRVGVAGAAELLSQAMNAFPDAAANANLAVDQMANVANISALSVEELQMALGNATRGASVFGASFSTTLTTLGLVRNIIPGIERASSGVAVAMERLAQRSTQAAIAQRTHVQVIDQSTGQFRDFLDIMAEMVPALETMTEAQRAQFLTGTFGAHAMGAVNAVLEQLTNGVRTNSGEMVRGADAVDYLRHNMENAGGAANNFASAILDTFPGQLQLLRGSIQTLAIEFGTPFAQVLRPAVESILAAVNGLIQAWHSLAPGTQHLIGQVVVLAGVMFSAFGAFALVIGAAMVMGPFLEVIAGAFLTMVATLVPLVVAFVALQAILGRIRVAFAMNLGGIADLFNHWKNRVMAAWNALVELFSTGSMSQATAHDLALTGNEFRRFVVNIFRIGYRIQRFFEGIGAGFDTAFSRMGPVVVRMVAAFRRLGAAFGFIDDDLESIASGSSVNFLSAGERMGVWLAGFLESAANGVTRLTDFFTSIVTGSRRALAIAQPGFDLLSRTFGMVYDQVGRLGDSLGRLQPAAPADEAVDGWTRFGQVLGVVATAFGIIAFVVQALVWFFSEAIDMVRWLGVNGLALLNVFADGVMNIVDGVTLLGLSIERALGIDGNHEGVAAIDRGIADREHRIADRSARPSGFITPAQLAADDAYAATAQATVQAASPSDSGPELRAILAEMRSGRRGPDGAPIEVRSTLQVDSDVLATSTARATASRRALGFASDGGGEGV